MKAVVATFNQEKALVGAFSVITNLRKELFQALMLAVIRLIRHHLHHLQPLIESLAWTTKIYSLIQTAEEVCTQMLFSTNNITSDGGYKGLSDILKSVQAAAAQHLAAHP